MMEKKFLEEAAPSPQAGNMGRLLLRSSRDFSELIGSRLKAHGHTNLRLPHADLIANLDWEGTRITTLAARAGMTKQSMGPLVKEMEEAGYLERSVDAKDRRAFLVKLSPKGERLLRDVNEAIMEVEAEYIAIVGAEQMQNLRESLALLIRYAEERFKCN